MKPTSKQPEQLSKLLDQLEDKLSKIEGKNQSDSRTEKTQEKNQQATSGSSSSVSVSTTPRLTSGAKSKEKSALAFDGSAVNGDPYTPPTRKRQLLRKIELSEEVMHRPKKSSDDEKSSSSNTPRSVRFTDSNTTPPLSHRSAAPTPTSTPMPTPAATPRTVGVPKDYSSSDSSGDGKPGSPRAKELRKKISKGFSKAAINIGKFGEKLSSQVSSISTSMLPTPKSSGRNSPEVQSSSRSSGKSNPYPEITPSVKNQAAQALLKLESDEDYKNSTVPGRRIKLLGALVEIMTTNKIDIEPRKIKMLEVEAIERSKNYEINAEIDIQTEPYASVIMERLISIEKNQWGGNSGDRGKKYSNMNESEKTEADLCFVPIFIRDEGSGFVHLKIAGEDGNYKDVSSLAELSSYLNQDDLESIGVRENGEVRIVAQKPDGSVEKNADGSTKTILTHSLRSKYISLFTCQFIANAMELLPFGGHPSITSSIKFYDGTPITLRGFSHTTWSYSKTVDGGVKVKMLIEKTPDPAIKGKKAILENGAHVTTQDGAIATIEAELYFSANRDLQIGNLKVHSSGWNLAKDI
jgi:hypothetical protein